MCVLLPSTAPQTNLLRKAKLQVEGSSELHAWDVSYYMGYVKSRE